MEEQYYIFVDKTGHCFEKLQNLGDDDCSRTYNDYLGAMLRGGKEFTVGDMLCFKCDLINAGFEWGKDFYVKKTSIH